MATRLVAVAREVFASSGRFVGVVREISPTLFSGEFPSGPPVMCDNKRTAVDLLIAADAESQPVLV